jgi:hypothetical protein
MGSKQKETRQLQKKKFERLIAERNALLAEKGIEKKKIAKDKILKHLRAKLNETVKALAAINAQEKVIEKARLQKQENAAKVKVKKPKSKKQESKPDPKAKDKKDKKQKKSDKKPDKKSAKK